MPDAEEVLSKSVILFLLSTSLKLCDITIGLFGLLETLIFHFLSIYVIITPTSQLVLTQNNVYQPLLWRSRVILNT